MKRLAQIVNLLLGMVSGGSLFAYASDGAVSWWLVVLVFAWVISAFWFATVSILDAV